MFRTIIDPQELHTLVDNNDPLVIVDCRFALNEPEKGFRDYLQNHIPGAYYAHLDDDLASPHIPGETGRHPFPDLALFRDLMRRFGVSGDSQVVAYDDRGRAIAARLWGLLRYCGHSAVAILDGGYPAWVDAGYEVTNQIPPEKDGDFEVDIQPEIVVDTEFMRQNHLNPEYRVIDARASERFLGETEPIDPIAGHIPGALSYPYEDNLTEDGRLRPVDELISRFEPLLGGTNPDSVIVYCGSGVTSILNQIAIEHAGCGRVRLYVGSWSEWITDPDAPIAVGEEDN